MGWRGLKRAKWECLQRGWPGDFVRSHCTAVIYCHIIMTFLSVTHVEVDALVGYSWEPSHGFMLCFSTSFCKLQVISMQILGLFFRGDWLAALVWVSTQQRHTLMWILRDKERYFLSKGIQTVSGKGKFSKSGSVFAPSNTVLNSKMTSWWALPAGVPSQSCRKHCVL